jgi:hypothetical protein
VLYHALIVRLSPTGPNEPSARRVWWTSDARASISERRHPDVRTSPELLSVFPRPNRDERIATDQCRAA